MDVQYSERGARMVAQPKGRMDASGGDRFAADLLGRLPSAATGVTIDLDNLELIEFGGVRSLLRLARDLRDQGCDLDFIGGGEEVRFTLDQAGLDDFFPFTPPYVSNRGKTNDVQ